MNRSIKFIILFLFLFSITINAQVINTGVGGNTTIDLLKRVDKDVISHQPDLTILMVGTNDMLNSKKMTSFNDYRDNLRLIVKQLKDNGIEVLLMSSPPVDSAFLFSRHNRSLFKLTPNEKMDSVSIIVKNIAYSNDLLFLNLYNKFKVLNLPDHNKDLFIRNPNNSCAADGVHPTSLGCHFIAENVFQFLKENKMIKADMKIVCFGDSITKGSGSTGAGTIAGENYPSFLSRRITEFFVKTKL